MTAYRPPRGGKSEGSGEKEKLVPRFGSSHLPAAIFRLAVKVALAPDSTPHVSSLSGIKSPAGAVRTEDRRTQSPVRPGGEFDEAAFGRAEAAYQFEFDKWQRIIDAAIADKGLSRDQRAAAVAALRIRQQAEAAGARKRVMEEEKQRARAAQHAARAIKGKPTP